MTNTSERRNTVSEKFGIKGVEDFRDELTLDAKVEAMLENRYDIVIRNVEYLLHKHGISQAEMCSKYLQNSPQPPQMTAYKKVGKDIPFRVIVRIGMAFGYTPEQLSGQLLELSDGRGQAVDKLPPRPYDEYMKYVGTYHMAYFNTDAAIGDNRRTAARDLAAGVLTIYAGDAVDGVPVLRVIAFSNCTEAEHDKLIRTVSSAQQSQSIRGIRACYSKVAAPSEGECDTTRMKCLYEGDLQLTDRNAEITMRQVRGGDVVHICLHNKAANSSEGHDYVGGMGTMMSTSRGEEHMPCVQSVILSRKGFANTAKEELAAALFLEPPTVKMEKETADIITYTRALFPSEDSDNPLAHLSNADKEYMLNAFIEKKITEVIKRNFLRYYKISSHMDSVIYKRVCR